MLESPSKTKNLILRQSLDCLYSRKRSRFKPLHFRGCVVAEQDGDDSSRNFTVKGDGTPHILIRAFWFLFIGWELTALWLTVAWVLNVSILGLPFGIKMINLTPKILTLKGKKVTKTVSEDGTEISRNGPEQREIWKRAIYFILVGWWLSLIWMSAGYILSITIIGLPLGIMMLNKLPEVTTLYRQK